MFKEITLLYSIMLNKYYFVVWLYDRQTIDICVEAASKISAKRNIETIYKDARLILNYKIE